MPTRPAIPQAAPDPCVLVVDDTIQNLRLVGGILSDAGYDIMPATSGAQALERVANLVPDLILLDLMMPEMDGLEVCRRLKASAATATVPVIFLTASGEVEHLLEAFAVGAVDYVTKPFNGAELLARVRTHIELKRAREALLQLNQRLRDLNDEKNEFLGIAAHDLRSPLNQIIGAAQLVLADPALAGGDSAEMVDIIRRAAEHMNQLVVNLLDANAIERGEMKLNPVACDLGALAADVVAAHHPRALAKQQSLLFTPPPAPILFRADRDSVIQVIDNLVSNAIKYSPRGKSVRVRVAERNGCVRGEVCDEGPGLTAADQKRLFGKFARLSARPTGGESSTGLGLSIVKRMVEAQEGRVWCESEPGRGSTFIVEFPASAEAAR
jgi:two-component system sensor histidine kinase/response regulator